MALNVCRHPAPHCKPCGFPIVDACCFSLCRCHARHVCTTFEPRSGTSRHPQHANTQHNTHAPVLLAWQVEAMVKRKSKHTCRKRAAHNGGGKRKPAVAPVAPGTAAGAASAPSSGSESDHSALRMNVMAKAVKTSADASPRASRAWTPLPSARASPRVTTPPVPAVWQVKFCCSETSYVNTRVLAHGSIAASTTSDAGTGPLNRSLLHPYYPQQPRALAIRVQPP